MSKKQSTIEKHLDAPKAPRVGPAQFIRNVRKEMRQVVWPTRKETVMTTIMVIIMVFFVAVFFFLADQVFSYAIKEILG